MLLLQVFQADVKPKVLMRNTDGIGYAIYKALHRCVYDKLMGRSYFHGDQVPAGQIGNIAKRAFRLREYIIQRFVIAQYIPGFKV